MYRSSFLLAAAALIGCSHAPDLTQPRSSDALANRTAQSGYTIVELPLLGGPVASGEAINEQGWVAGLAVTSAGNVNAALWRNNTAKNLGTLGGPNSEVQWPGLNNRGNVVGFSDMATLEPLGEHWSCTAFYPLTGHVCRGFYWHDNHMIEMPTLGGDNSLATEVNDHGFVVGWAETAVHDPTCHAPQVLQFRAVVWHPESGRIRALPPLHGDSVSSATAINDRDQVVGISGACDTAVGATTARRAVMWDHGRVIDIGSLGGTAWNTAMALNNDGVVVGFADLAGDQNGANPNFHAFRWSQAEGIADLKTLQGDAISQALYINSWGQIVGFSAGGTGLHAVLWDHGKIQNLQSLMPVGFADTLQVAQAINDEGQITGQVKQANTNTFFAFIATPIRR